MAWILWAHDVGAYGVGSQDLGLRWAEGLLGRELGRRPFRGGIGQWNRYTGHMMWGFMMLDPMI